MSFIDSIRNTLAELVRVKATTKQEEFLYLLKTNAIVSVILDPKVDKVIVPEQYSKHDTLVLQYGLNLANPIPDLNVGEDGISATLSFSRVSKKTFVPWDAVLAMFPGKPGPVGPGTPNLLVLKGGGETTPVNTAKLKIAA
jgi:hypothetical protein